MAKKFTAPTGADVGTLPVAQVFAMPGEEFMRGMLAGDYPLPPIAEALRMRLVEAENGRITFASAPDGTLLNPIGSVHGGYAMAMLDSSMGCAVHSTLEKGEAYTTVEAKVNIVRPIMPEMGVVRAIGTVIHRGRSIATAEGKLFGPTGKLLAHGTTTCSIMLAPIG